MTTAIRYIAIILTAALAACGNSSTEPQPSLQTAEQALAAGDLANAVEVANKLTSSADTAKFSCHDCCIIATIYALAYENNIDADRSMAQATTFFGRAASRDLDSLRAYADNVPPEQTAVVNNTLRVLSGLSVDVADIDEHEQED